MAHLLFNLLHSEREEHLPLNLPSLKKRRLVKANMKVPIYNQQGEEIGVTELPEEIFGVPFNSDLVHQVVVSQMANRRQVIAHTKDRGEVRGGGRKPWRQKGTGRARAGSIRSPLWRGGGVTFGPTKERNFKKTIPQKMRRKALFMVLSQKLKDNEIIILDGLNLKKPKTKEMTSIIQKLKTRIQNEKAEPKKQEKKNRESFLIALAKMDKDVILASRNIPRVATIQAKDLNCLDILSYKYLTMPKEAITLLQKTFLKK